MEPSCYQTSSFAGYWSGIRNGAINGRKIAMGHSFIGHLRTLFNFGSSILEDPDCERLSVVLHKRKFEQPAPRTEALSAEQATAHRAMSHERGWPSMAIAQALQFELTLTAKGRDRGMDTDIRAGAVRHQP
jgi:hypothetical protein